ncbi:MAG: PEP-CTERM sorting domain-containing protein [Planctomycetia bacterium]|nr:PEP-CTERM sorting domain-containing protein [Planctomycetia bacterium]
MPTSDNVNYTSGTWNISGGTVGSTDKNLYFGNSTITMTNGNIDADQFRPTSSGTGSMDHSGGVVTTQSWMAVGELAGAEGTYTLSGEGTLNQGLSLGHNAFVLGGYGTGTLKMTGGEMNLSGNHGGYSAILGYHGTGIGYAYVSGGTITSKNGILLGFSSTLSSSFKQSGGTVKVENGEIYIKANNSYLLEGGTLSVPKITNNGTFSMTGGTLNVAETNFALNQGGGNLSPGGDGIVGNSKLLGLEVTAGKWTLDFTENSMDMIEIGTGGLVITSLEEILLVGNELAEEPLSFLTFTETKTEGLAETLSSLLKGTMASYYHVIDTVEGYALAVNSTDVPEPSSWLLLLAGLGCCFAWRRKRG